MVFSIVWVGSRRLRFCVCFIMSILLSIRVVVRIKVRSCCSWLWSMCFWVVFEIICFGIVLGWFSCCFLFSRFVRVWFICMCSIIFIEI